MTTAFQSNAFQNNAFQIDSDVNPTTGAGSQGTGAYGAYLKWKRERKYRYKKRKKLPIQVKNIIKDYNNALTIIDNNEDSIESKLLISSIDPYIWPINSFEMNRRLSAEYSVNIPPPARRVDFEALFGNALALEKFEANIQKINNARIIQERLELQYNEDSDMMIMILASL